MDKQQEIINKILEIPLEKWNGYETELNGKKIILHPTHTNLNKFFIIDGVELRGEGVAEFKEKLEDFQKKKLEEKKQAKIDHIHQQLVL